MCDLGCGEAVGGSGQILEGIASQEEEFRFGARGNRNPREDSEPKVDLN